MKSRIRPGRVATGVIVAVVLVGVGLMIAQDQETLRVRSTLAATEPAFPAYLARLLGDPMTEGDAYVVHTDGVAAFPAMLAAIDAARTRISLETYIFANDDTGQKFATALERAARRGVKVKVVLDSVGASEIAGIGEQLERAGVQVGWYNRVVGFSLEEANYRTHRKALVVDGAVAFVGGMGLADQWARDVEGEPRWRDTQIELRGPIVDNVEAAFNQNWIETVGLAEPEVQATTGRAHGTGRSIVVWSSSEGGMNGLKLLYLLAIASARKTIDIQSPYVVTDESTLWSLQEARKRGVRVRILMEGDVTDAKPVKFAGRAGYDTLLASDIELFEYQPSMMHAKAMMVDGLMTIVGSANFDNRSLELNDELNVVAFDTALAERLTADFERDITRSTRIDPEAWRSRPLHIRAREKGWSLFGEIF